MNLNAKKGEWVEIQNIVLESEERTARIPEDTKKTPLQMWVKGFLKEDSQFEEKSIITTLTGREVEGKLIESNPKYIHNFGEEFIPELLQIGIQVRRILKEGEE